MNVTATLQKYFLLRREMGGGGPLGRDPTSSRIPGSDFNGSIAILCDVGVCLACLSTAHRDIIYDRWELWLALDDAHNAVARWSSKAVSSLIANRRRARSHARAKKKDCVDKVDALTIQLRQIDNGRVYQAAIWQLKADIEERDQRARAVYGDRAGFSGV